MLNKDLFILIADDILGMRRLLRQSLRSMGFHNIIEAVDGVDAIEKLTTNSVDLILSDWNMPNLLGIDVLKFVRSKKEYSHIPFIMITEEVSEATIAEAAETEVDAYIIKPFTLGQLQDRITNILSSSEEYNKIDYYLERGKAFVVTKQFSNAMIEFKNALRINPRSPRALLEFGNMYAQQGNDKQAKLLYQKSIAISPKFLKAHDALANLCLATSDNDGYLHHLQNAVAISPRNLERRFMLGQALIKHGCIDNAKKILENILEDAGKQYTELVSKIGDTMLSLGSFEIAEKAFNKAISNDSTNLRLFNQQGIVLRKQGKYKEAISNYYKALRIAPNDENLHYNLSKALYGDGQLTLAIKTLHIALRLNPQFEEARLLLHKFVDQEEVKEKEYGLKCKAI